MNLESWIYREAIHHLLSRTRAVSEASRMPLALARTFMEHGFPILDDTGQAWLRPGEEL